jgi:hypothetical protein
MTCPCGYADECNGETCIFYPLQDGGLCAVEPCLERVQPQPEYDPFLPTGARIAHGMKAKPD